MKHLGQKTLRLQCELILRRNPVAAIAVATWLGALATWLALVPQLHAMHTAQGREIALVRERLREAEAAPQVWKIDASRQRLETFYTALGEEDEVGEQLRRIFALAAQNGVQLNVADYRAAEDATGRFRTYQVTLPVEGSYQSMRQFCEQVLIAIPFAALDDIGFRRNLISTNKLEARLRFTLYFKGAQPDGAALDGTAVEGRP